MTERVKRRPPASVDVQLSGPTGTAEQRARVADLGERLYRHVLRAVAPELLYQLEQCIWSELDRLAISDETGDLTSALLTEALGRVGYGEERHVDMIPDGITNEEIIAAEYDDTCLMCRHEVADMEYRRSGRKCTDLHRDAEARDLMELMRHAADMWRAEHAESLRRFGLIAGGAR